MRHFLSILLLPFVVVVVIPYTLMTVFAASDSRWTDGSLLAWPARLAGAVIFLVGFGLFAWCVWLFARVGRGTLAPWDPPREFVAVGPYRHVRNPMISSVLMMLIGLALVWGSLLVGMWAGVAFLVNHVYFMFSEEPGLERRFGESYRVYKANVPRWIPRLTPWVDSDVAD